MDTNLRHERPAPDPHFEHLHGPPLNYPQSVQSVQSLLQAYGPQPARTAMAEASGFSHPTVPNADDFTNGKAPASNMPPPPTPAFLSGFQTPCESPCSILNCGSGCNPSFGSGTCSLVQCNNLDQCTSEECCREPACFDHRSLPTTRRESTDFSAEDEFASSSSRHQFANSDTVYPAYDSSTGFDNVNVDPLQCHWLLPDQECDITAPTNDALSQHVLHDHIQPDKSLICGSSDYDERMDAQKLTHDLWSSQQPEQNADDSYVCLWDGCMESFADAEQLETHMEAAHTQLESIDCRWGGCGTITANSAELQSHVNKEHLHFHVQPVLTSWGLEMGPWNSYSSRRPNHPLYWTPESDDLLMRVRAQNLTFRQIASQYFPDKSAQACQDRYARLYRQQEQFDPQPIKQSPPLLSYTPLQPASIATSPYESHHALVDPSLIQTSPTILSNHSSQLVFNHPPIHEDYKCMWITDDATETLCEARFGNPNELQFHVESSHSPLSEIRKRRSTSLWVCKWMGCALKRETRGSRDKLKKHICTHTGCKSILSTNNPCNSSISQTTPSLADIVVNDFGMGPNLPIMNAPIQGRSLTSAICVRWPLRAVMDCVSSSMSF